MAHQKSQPVQRQNVQPVSILITADTNTQTKYLNERCLQLESYCRDLIKTNKVLDMENKLCITQILNLTNANSGGTNQLNNFVGALNLIQNKSKPIYSSNSIGQIPRSGSNNNRASSSSGINQNTK